MNINFARKMDQFGAPLLCYLLKAIDAIRPGTANPPDAKTLEPKRILIIKFFGMGSILQMTPMLNALRKNYPKTKISMLTFEQNIGLAKLLPMVDQICTISFRRGLMVFAYQIMRNVLTFRGRFDLIINGEFFSYFSAMTTQLIRRRNTLTFGFYNNRRAKEWIFTHHISIDHSMHINRQFTKMLCPLGIADDGGELADCELTIGADVHESLDAVLADVGVDDASTVLAVNINASNLSYNRRWPVDRYNELINRILRQQWADKIHIALIGGADDTGYVGPLAARMANPRVHDLSGRISLMELTSLLSRCRLFIGNDSGPLHLAVACRTPTISLFGPETPRLYGPTGDAHRVFYAEYHCSPCLNVYFSKDTRCKDNLCMQAIETDEVFRAVEQCLHASPDNKEMVTR